MTDPLVSVVMGVFNGEPFLRAAVESVLGQSYPSLELIVVDDGSSDGSGDVAAAYPGVRVLRQPNRGLPSALNKGISAAKGAYLSFLDADDLWPRERLRLLVDHLQGNRALGFVGGRVSEFHDDAKPVDLSEDEIARLSNRAALSLGCMLIRADVFRDIGPFNAELLHSQDVDWVNRAKEAGIPMEILPVLALHRRRHGSSSSGKHPDRRRSDFLRAVKLAMDRRRGVIKPSESNHRDARGEKD